MPSALRHTFAALLALLFVVAFLALLVAVAVRAELADPEFYTSALDDSDAYDRLYEDLPEDPDFARGRSSLLGNMTFPEGAAVRIIERVVPPERLEAGVERAVDRIIDVVKDGGDVDVRIEITGFVERIQEIIPDETQSAVENAPAEEVGDDDGLVASVNQAVADLSEGKIPEAVPVSELSESARQRVSATIVDAANLDPSDPDDAATIASVDAELADQDVRGAIRAAVSPAIEERLAEARQTIDEGDRVEIEGSGEDARYYIVPAPQVQEDIESWLKPVNAVYEASLWIAIGSAIAMVAAIALIGVLFRGREKAASRWFGGAMVAAGLLAILVWVIGLRIAQDEIQALVAPTVSDLPETYIDIARSVIAQAEQSLALVFWVPGLALMVTGTIVWVASMSWSRATSRPPHPQPPHV